MLHSVPMSMWRVAGWRWAVQYLQEVLILMGLLAVAVAVLPLALGQVSYGVAASVEGKGIKASRQLCPCPGGY